MALVPKIDAPCPLGQDELRRLNGHCGRCATQVHALDGLDETQRRALLAAAEGPICVSYRVPRRPAPRRSAGFGIAIAATLVSGGAFAAEPPSPLTPSAEANASPVQAAPLLPAPAAGEECESTKLEWIEVIGGGVNDPRDAHWVDDSELPELPQRDANALETAFAAVDRNATPEP